MIVGKFLDPKNDFAFKKVFGTEQNKDILIHFLNDILEFDPGANIKDIKFLKTIQEPEVAAKKQSIIDVLCTDEKGRQIIVEMQVAHRKGFEKRAQYYAAKAYTSQMNEGGKYHDLKEVIFLAITDFVMFPQKKAYKSNHITLDKKTKEQDLKDFSFTFLELPKFEKDLNHLTTMQEKWMYFFKHAQQTHEKDIEKLIGEDGALERAYEELNRFSWSEEEINTYEKDKKSDMDAEAALDYAHDKGLKKGKEEAALAIAQNLLDKGHDLEFISTVTGLSLKKLKDL